MANLSGKLRADYVRRMFSRIARRYDRANRWMSWGQDARWRRAVLDAAALPGGGRLLDLGAGTGDLALLALKRDPSVQAVAADFTPEMMAFGRRRPGGMAVHWLNADALELPFDQQSFDAVVSAYLLRNVIDLDRVLAEQYRVLKPGGRMVCLDTSPLPGDLLHLPARVYTHYVIPMMGKVLSGDAQAYRYLPDSTDRFLTAGELCARMIGVGFTQVRFRHFMGGAMALHWATR